MAVWLAGGALVVAVIALAVAGQTSARSRAARRAYRGFTHGGSGDVFAALDRQAAMLEEMRHTVAEQTLLGEDLRGVVAGSVSRVATVPYDAFDDMGGQLSFSSALLDGHGDGVVFTSINGRDESRTYAKTIIAGDSRSNLSDEEHEAILRALDGSGAVSDARGRRSGRA